MQPEFSTQSPKNIEIQHFMKIRQKKDKLLHANVRTDRQRDGHIDKQTDGHDEAYSL